MEVFTNQSNYHRAARRLTSAYLFAVCLGLPLVFWQKYFDITEAKLSFFLGLSLLYLLLLLLARLFYPLDFGAKPERLRPHSAALALFALALCLCVGSALGGHSEDAIWGQNNRYQGIFTLLTYAAVVFALSRQTIDPRLPARALVLGAAPVCLLGVLNHFGVDPLGFYDNLRSLDQGRFLSTLGNANFFGSYISLAFPVVLGWFVLAARRRTRALLALALCVCSFGALVAGSDSTALGLLAAALLFPLALFSDAPALRRYFAAWMLFALCALSFGLLSRVLPSATYLSGFALALSSPAVSGALFALSALLWLLTRAIDPARLPCLQKPYLLFLFATALLGAIALILLNTALSDISLGGAERYLRFSAGWGTDRGKIWMFAVRLYASYSPAQLLFGAGPGALYHADAAARVFSDAALDTAHNEYLQYLLISGAAGLAAYLSALVLAARAGIRKGASSPICRVLVVALIAYAAQASVNIAQPMSTPLVFLLIGVLISRAPEETASIAPKTGES